MAKAFRKSMLKVGTYHSPDGVVEVTPERLRHWSDEFKKLTKAGQVVPMHWDHSEKIEDLQPVSMDAFKKRERSASNSVGRLTKFDVAPDGKSANIEFVTLTNDATEKTASNAVYVSPVIFPEWKDGHGHTYTDVITHMDIVDHPVDHSQGPARPVMCAIRMGYGNKPYKMSDDEMMDDDDKKKLDDEDMPSEDDVLEMGMDEDEMPMPMPEPEPPAGPSIQDVMQALGRLGLVLPSDTDESNFIDRVRTAAIAKAASETEPEMEDDPMMGNESAPVVQDPQIATMSLQARAALAFGEKQHRKSINEQLDSLLRSGRCTPAEYNQQKQAVGAIKLSLDKSGNPRKSSVESWIESREACPKGTFWSEEQKLKATRMSVQPQPGPYKFDKSISNEEADAIADRHLKKLGL